MKMRIVVYIILSTIIPFSLSHNQETKNTSNILSLDHSSSSITHIHESVDGDEGTGFRIDSNFFIGNNPTRGKRDSDNNVVDQKIKNQLVEVSLNFQDNIKKTKEEIDFYNRQIKNIPNDIKDDMTLNSSGKNNITYCFSITILLALLLSIVY